MVAHDTVTTCLCWKSAIFPNINVYRLKKEEISDGVVKRIGTCVAHGGSMRVDKYRIVRSISREFQTLIRALKTYRGIHTEYEMLIIEPKLMINISYLVYRPRYVFRAQISVWKTRLIHRTIRYAFIRNWTQQNIR